MASEIDSDSIMDPDKYRAVSSPEEVAAKVRSAPSDVKSFLKRNVPPIAAMGAGAGLAGAVGTALAPESGGLSLAIPLLASAIGSGTANVAANKYLPEQYGGDPKSSAMRSFALGAGPELLGAGIGLKANKAAERVGNEGMQEQVTGLYKTVADAVKPREPGPAEAGKLANALGRPNLSPPPVLPMEQRGAAVREYRDAVTGPIERMGDKYGAPIGAAYSKIKNPEQPIELEDLYDNVQKIRDGSISPISPAANKFLDEAKMLTERGRLEARPSGGRTMLDRPADTAESIRASEGETPASSYATDARAKRELSEHLFPSASEGSGATDLARPTSIGDVVNLRQRVQSFLRNAQKGDRYVLGNLRQDLDKRLVDHLPEDIGPLRANYKQYIDTFPYQGRNALNRMQDPSEINKYVFGQTPAHTLDIVRGATKAERKVIQTGFAAHALQGVDLDLPIPDQIAAVQAKIDPYLRNGTVRELYGPSANLEMRNLLRAPIWRERLAANLASPESQKSFEAAAMDIAKSKKGTSAMEAANAGFTAWAQQLPARDQAMLKRMLISHTPDKAPLPVLLSPEATATRTIGQRLITSAEKPGIERTAGRRAQFAGPLGIGRAAAGSAGGVLYAGAQLGTAAVLATSKAGYRAFLNAGGAEQLGRLYSAPSSRAFAKTLFDTFAAMGTRGLNAVVPDDKQ